MRSKNRSPSVSATDIGNACYCPHSLELRLAGKPETSESKANKKRGTFLHGVQNEHAYSRAKEISLSTGDSRCYVATHLFGIDHPKTQRLRMFRDRILLQSFTGRLFVRSYYRLSPKLINICTRYPLINSVVSAQVAFFHYLVEKYSTNE